MVIKNQVEVSKSSLSKRKNRNNQYQQQINPVFFCHSNNRNNFFILLESRKKTMDRSAQMSMRSIAIGFNRTIYLAMK